MLSRILAEAEGWIAENAEHAKIRLTSPFCALCVLSDYPLHWLVKLKCCVKGACRVG